MLEVLRVFARLGLTSFGGPVAHLAYFRTEFVERRGWLSEGEYAELVALAQFLPGPASSQVGFAIGLLRAGWAGAIAAWFAFTLPSAVIMVVIAWGAVSIEGRAASGAVHALMLVAVAVVAHAVGAMARSLAPDLPRRAIAAAAAVVLFLWGGPLVQLAAIAGGALLGWFMSGRLVANGPPDGLPTSRRALSKRAGVATLAALGALLVALPFASADAGVGSPVDVADSFSRAGALVFGGGHVVLPLLEAHAVDGGWVTQDQFLAGYGFAQALPGPLFSFAAYLGALAAPGAAGIGLAVLAVIALFVPGLMLMTGVLPWWAHVRARKGARALAAGASAAVVGVLAAGWVDPVVTHAVGTVADAAVVCLLLAALLARVPVVAVVASAAVAGAAFALA